MTPALPFSQLDVFSAAAFRANLDADGLWVDAVTPAGGSDSVETPAA